MSGLIGLREKMQKKDRIIKTILLYNSILWERTNVAERNTTNPSSKGGDSKLILSETFTFLYFVAWAKRVGDPNEDGRGGHFKDYWKAIKSLIVRFENGC